MSGCRRLLSLLRDTPCHKHIILTYLLLVNYYLANMLGSGEEYGHRFTDQ